MALDFTSVGEVMVDVVVASGRHAHDAAAEVRAGGTALNAALWAAAAGARARVIGSVGRDDGAELVRAMLKRHGVVDATVAHAGSPTGTVVRLDEDAYVDRGANALLAPDHVQGAPGDAVLVSGYVLFQADTEAAGRAALATRARWTAVTGGSPAHARRAAAGLLAGARLVVANEAEALALTGAGPEEAARRLASVSEIGCVTLGAEGAVLARGGEVERVRAAATGSGRDGTGAGDAFAAVLLVALAEGAATSAALEAASRAGARAAAGERPGRRTAPRPACE